MKTQRRLAGRKPAYTPVSARRAANVSTGPVKLASKHAASAAVKKASAAKTRAGFKPFEGKKRALDSRPFPKPNPNRTQWSRTSIPATAGRLSPRARLGLNVARNIGTELAVASFMRSIPYLIGQRSPMGATPVGRPMGQIVPLSWQGSYPDSASYPPITIWRSGQPGVSTYAANSLAAFTPWLSALSVELAPSFVAPNVSNRYVGFYDTPLNPSPAPAPIPNTRILDLQGIVYPWPREMPSPDLAPAPWVYPRTRTERGTYNKPEAQPGYARTRNYGPPVRNISIQLSPNGRPSVRTNIKPVRPPRRVKETKYRGPKGLLDLLALATESLDFLTVLYKAAGGQKHPRIKGRVKHLGEAGRVGPGEVSFPEMLDFLFNHMRGFDQITAERFVQAFWENAREDKSYGHLGRMLSKFDPTRRGPHGDPNRPVGIAGGPVF